MKIPGLYRYTWRKHNCEIYSYVKGRIHWLGEIKLGNIVFLLDKIEENGYSYKGKTYFKALFKDKIVWTEYYFYPEDCFELIV